MTIRALIKETATAFAAAAISDARLEAEWLCAHVLGRDRLQLFLEGGEAVPAEALARLAELRRRRLAGEPLQYLLGTAEFYGLRLEVGPGVLIPRPETEELVALALEHYPGHGPVCDLCTGSGAVALALAQFLPDHPPVYATEISPAALAYARRNHARLGLDNLVLLEGDLFAPLPVDLRFGLIVANPPYVSPRLYAELPCEVRDFEPRLALFAEEDGLAVLHRIASDGHARLLAGGWLLSEIGSEQQDGAAALFEEHGYRSVTVAKDSFGKPRFVLGKHSGVT